MKKYNKKYNWFYVLLVLMMGCREEFSPNIDPADTNLLVVEGFISTNGELSQIKMSRTGNLNDQGFTVESNATLELRGENSGSYQFAENTAGTYSMSAILPHTQKYRLGIRLKNNEEYQSDLMQPLFSSEIEDLNWKKGESGVTIQLTTQGTDENQYFLWQIEENWLYRSAIGSSYRYLADQEIMEEVTAATSVSRCWNDNRIQRIVIDNAARFSDDKISNKEITVVPNFSEKLGIRYSILVKQITLDRAGFDFWEIMRKNTEDIGGIFSPLPSLIGGNIKKLDTPNSTAVGYVSMGIASQKRIYINTEEIRPWPVNIPDYDACVVRPDTISPKDYSRFFRSGDLMPVMPIFGDLSPVPISFRAATKFCADCRERGGSVVRPDFWED